MHQAPQDFLLRLLTHVNGKLAFFKQQIQPQEAVECASPVHQELASKAQMALEVYRRMVPPGVYRFYAEMSQGEYTGEIVEEWKDFGSRSKDREFGPVFGFGPGVTLPSSSPATLSHGRSATCPRSGVPISSRRRIATYPPWSGT